MYTSVASLISLFSRMVSYNDNISLINFEYFFSSFNPNFDAACTNVEYTGSLVSILLIPNWSSSGFFVVTGCFVLDCVVESDVSVDFTGSDSSPVILPPHFKVPLAFKNSLILWPVSTPICKWS